jgi:uncharacterized protein YegJ (DUF2314 family)
MELPAEAVVQAIERARGGGGRIVLNLAPAVIIPEASLDAVDVLILNAIEARILAHAFALHGESARELAVQIAERRQLPVIMQRFCLALVLLLSAAVPADAQSVLDRARRDEVTAMPDADPQMQRAFGRARASLDGFLTLAANPRAGAERFSVKVGIREGGTTEYFWIAPFRRSGDSFSGRLANTPRLVSNVRQGQTVTFSRSDIVDWMYLENGRMRGNFTACALLTREPEAQRAAFERQYGLSCD